MMMADHIKQQQQKKWEDMQRKRRYVGRKVHKKKINYEKHCKFAQIDGNIPLMLLSLFVLACAFELDMP